MTMKSTLLIRVLLVAIALALFAVVCTLPKHANAVLKLNTPAPYGVSALDAYNAARGTATTSTGKAQFVKGAGAVVHGN